MDMLINEVGPEDDRLLYNELPAALQLLEDEFPPDSKEACLLHRAHDVMSRLGSEMRDAADRFMSPGQWLEPAFTQAAVETAAAAARATVQLERLVDAPNFRLYAGAASGSGTSDPEAELFALMEGRHNVVLRAASILAKNAVSQLATGSGGGPTVEEISGRMKIGPLIDPTPVPSSGSSPSSGGSNVSVPPNDYLPNPGENVPDTVAFLEELYARSSLPENIGLELRAATQITRTLSEASGFGFFFNITNESVRQFRYAIFKQQVEASFGLVTDDDMAQLKAQLQAIRREYLAVLAANDRQAYSADATNEFRLAMRRKAADSALVNVLKHYSRFNEGLNALVAFDLAAGCVPFMSAAILHGLCSYFFSPDLTESLFGNAKPHVWVANLTGLNPPTGAAEVNAIRLLTGPMLISNATEAAEVREWITSTVQNANVSISVAKSPGALLEWPFEPPQTTFDKATWEIGLFDKAKYVPIPKSVKKFVDGLKELWEREYDPGLVRTVKAYTVGVDAVPPRILDAFKILGFQKSADFTPTTVVQRLFTAAQRFAPVFKDYTDAVAKAREGKSALYQLLQRFHVGQNLAFYGTFGMAFATSASVLGGGLFEGTLGDMGVHFMARLAYASFVAYRTDLLQRTFVRAVGVLPYALKGSQIGENLIFNQPARMLRDPNAPGHVPKSLREALARRPPTEEAAAWNFLRGLVLEHGLISLPRRFARSGVIARYSAYLLDIIGFDPVEMSEGLRNFQGSMALGKTGVNLTAFLRQTGLTELTATLLYCLLPETVAFSYQLYRSFSVGGVVAGVLYFTGTPWRRFWRLINLGMFIRAADKAAFVIPGTPFAVNAGFMTSMLEYVSSVFAAKSTVANDFSWAMTLTNPLFVNAAVTVGGAVGAGVASAAWNYYHTRRREDREDARRNAIVWNLPFFGGNARFNMDPRAFFNQLQNPVEGMGLFAFMFAKMKLGYKRYGPHVMLLILSLYWLLGGFSDLGETPQPESSWALLSGTDHATLKCHRSRRKLNNFLY